MAFAEIGVEIIFKGENVNEVAVLNYIDEKVFIERVGEVYLDNFRKRIGDEVVGVDPQYFRPTEVDRRCDEGAYPFGMGTKVRFGLFDRGYDVE